MLKNVILPVPVECVDLNRKDRVNCVSHSDLTAEL